MAELNKEGVGQGLWPRLLEFLGEGSDVFHPVLVRSQVALKGLVTPQECTHLLQRS